MSDDSFQRLIEQGDVDAVRRALERDSTLANRTIRWHLNRDNESDPLHCISDGPDKKDQVGAARILLAAGANARTSNKQGRSALELADTCANRDMYELLKRYV